MLVQHSSMQYTRVIITYKLLGQYRIVEKLINKGIDLLKEDIYGRTM